jgi:hypothetical protein
MLILNIAAGIVAYSFVGCLAIMAIGGLVFWHYCMAAGVVHAFKMLKGRSK